MHFEYTFRFLHPGTKKDNTNSVLTAEAHNAIIELTENENINILRKKIRRILFEDLQTHATEVFPVGFQDGHI